jgi:predicted RecA/RadA family phage recombinase
MKNFVQPGNTITLAAPTAVTSGAGVLVGTIFGIAAHDAASGDPVETVTTGVFDVIKIGSQTWGVGDKVYWDNTNKRVTKVATDNTLIGVALVVVGSGADETTGRVRLNGSF